MADHHWSPTFRTPERKPTPTERLFEFVRDDDVPMACEVRFHGESYGWEALIDGRCCAQLL